MAKKTLRDVDLKGKRGIRRLEELLVIVMKLRLDGRVALVRLGVLTVAFAGGTAAFDIGHFTFLLISKRKQV